MTMSTSLSIQNLKRWISDAIEGFKSEDLLGVSESWLLIYGSLAEYIGNGVPADNNLLWMIEGTDESLPDVIYQLQRLKNALIAALVREQAAEQIPALLIWFDRTIVTLVEKDSGKMSRERTLSKPYETIFWKSRDGMYISTLEGRFLHCNEALLKMLKFDSVEDLRSLDITTQLYLDPVERQVMLEHLSRDEFYDHHEFRFRTQTGEERTAMESCYLVEAPGGGQLIVGIMVDVSREKDEQRKSEQYIKGIEKSSMENLLSLRRRSRRFDALLGLNDHAVLLLDPKDFSLIQCNKAFNKRYKHGRKPLENFSFRDMFRAEEWARVFAQITHSVNRHHFHVRGTTCVAPDGSSFQADLSVWVHEDDEGGILFVQIEDRSELLCLQAQQELARQNFENLISSLPLGVIGFKSDGNVGLINRYLMEFTGYTSKQLRNMSFLNRLFARDEQRLKFQKYIRRFTQGFHAENVTVELKARDGEVLLFKLTTLSYQFPGDDKPGFLAVLSDISDRVSLERLMADQQRMPSALVEDYRSLEEGLIDVQNALEGLRHKNRFRQRFIDVVTEKFKSPIHVVLGYASLLTKDLSDKMTPSQREDMGIIASQISGMLEMLDKAIEFAHLDAEKVSHEPQVYVVRTMLDQIFERLRPPQLAAAVAMRMEHQILSLDLAIQVDKTLVESLLRQVVQNAVQYTQQGSIEVTAYEERGKLFIEVQDTGCGISPTDMPQVFEPFFRGTPDLPAPPGMGLGLAIAQAYADLLGANIEIFSRLHEGTRFVLCLGRMEERAESPRPVRGSLSSV